jgi:hypothetical protein
VRCWYCSDAGGATTIAERAIAPPWTRSTRLSAASRSKSRGRVMGGTGKTAASSTTVTERFSATISRMRLRHSGESRFSDSSRLMPVVLPSLFHAGREALAEQGKDRVGFACRDDERRLDLEHVLRCTTETEDDALLQAFFRTAENSSW